MKLRVVAMGHRMPTWVTAGWDEYARRMPREFPLELVALKPEARDGKPVERLLAAEAERIVGACKGMSIVALDERGPHASLPPISLAGARARSPSPSCSGAPTASHPR